MYMITDNYGTVQFAWTYKEALSWLAACSWDAAVTNWCTGKVIARRFQLN